MKRLDLKDCEYLVLGAALLGTGGGGDPLKAGKELERMAESGRLPSLASMDELEPDSLVCTAFMIGSGGSQEQSSEPILLAKKKLENLIGEINAIMPVEIGAGAVAEAMFLASRMGLPFLDGDIVGGRSAPEVYLETITMFNIPRTPLAVANQEGEVKILPKSPGYRETERFLRDFSARSGGCAYVIGYPMRLSAIKGIVGVGTVSKSIGLGRIIRTSENPLKDILEKTGGTKLFSGRITKVERGDKDGFLTGEVTISDKKSELRVWFKNENLIAWLDDKPLVTAPDLICLLGKDCRGLYNRDLETGTKVTAIGIPALPIWRTKRGIELFGPKSFGFDIKYKPLDKLIKR